MNLTLDQFIDGFERSARELPSVFEEWNEIDLELREEYADQLLWMLQARPDVVARATRERRYIELVQRINAVTSALFDMRGALAEKMGIPTDRIVPDTVYTTTEQPENFSPSVVAMAA